MRVSRLCFILGSVITFSILTSLVLDAQNTSELLKASKEYSAKGAYQQSMNLINRAISYDTTQAELYLQRATVYFFLEEYDNSIKDCYAALRFKPDIPEVYALRGKVCMITKSYGGAILFFGKALKNTSNADIHFDVYLNRGKAYFELNRINDAFVDFQTAYALNDTSTELLIPLADTYLRMHRPAEALATLNRVIASNPNFAPAYELMGRIAIENKNFPEAIMALEKYTALNPASTEAYNQLAEIYRMDKQYDKAMNALNRSLSIDPLESNAYKIKGMIYFDMGENEKGCNALFRSMQLGYFEKYGYDLLDIYQSRCEEK